MAQCDVFDWLKLQRKKGIDIYFTVNQVKQGLRDMKIGQGSIHGVPGDLLRLLSAGFVEKKMSGNFRDWHMLFRLKKKYMNGD